MLETVHMCMGVLSTTTKNKDVIQVMCHYYELHKTELQAAVWSDIVTAATYIFEVTLAAQNTVVFNPPAGRLRGLRDRDWTCSRGLD